MTDQLSAAEGATILGVLQCVSHIAHRLRRTVEWALLDMRTVRQKRDSRHFGQKIPLAIKSPPDTLAEPVTAA